jgi:hypothetical protein
MTDQERAQFVERAEALYKQRLKTQLEKTHRDYFVAIEPDSGDYFLGRTMSEAGQTARRAHPDRLTYLMRIGHEAAIEMMAFCM